MLGCADAVLKEAPGPVLQDRFQGRRPRRCEGSASPANGRALDESSCMASHTPCRDSFAAYSNPCSVWPTKRKVFAGWVNCQETSLKSEVLAPFGAFELRVVISTIAADHGAVHALVKQFSGTSVAKQCLSECQKSTHGLQACRSSFWSWHCLRS